MAVTGKVHTGKEANEEVTKESLIAAYMNYVLEKGEQPGTVYQFCKEQEITEDTFYNFFGSFESLRKEIWNQFFTTTIHLMQNSAEYSEFNTREKLLTFYYTFFEMLTANRSYILFTLKKENGISSNLEQLKGLRKNIKMYATSLITEENEQKSAKYLKRNETIFSEGVWLQTMFLIKFWLKDDSAGFESTDVAIEKSVNTAFDLFDTTPLERLVDFGKFLWKEKMV